MLAAGFESTRLGATAGLALPIYPLKGYSITIKPLDGELPRASITDTRRKVVFAPLGKRVRVAGFVEIGGDTTSIPPGRIGALLDAAREVLGYRAVDGDLRPWAGQRPATPSGRPILGRTRVGNLFLNSGRARWGGRLRPAVRGWCATRSPRTPTIDLAPYLLPAA